MKIAIASDHAGYRYKELLKEALAERGHEVVDFGTDSTESTDYPRFVHPAAAAVALGRVRSRHRPRWFGQWGGDDRQPAPRGALCPLLEPTRRRGWRESTTTPT